MKTLLLLGLSVPMSEIFGAEWMPIALGLIGWGLAWYGPSKGKVAQVGGLLVVVAALWFVGVVLVLRA